MWPDVKDVQHVLKIFPEPKPDALAIWPDVVLSVEFLIQSVGYCFDEHDEFITSSKLKSIIDSFVGRDVNELAVRVALRLGPNLKRKPSKTDPSVLLVKIPGLNKFEEARDQWKAIQRQLDQIITEERMEMSRVRKW